MANSMKNKLQSEFVNRVRSEVKSVKVKEYTLRPNGISFEYLMRKLGPAFAGENIGENQYRIALIQK